MKPASIKKFDLFYLGSIAVGAIGFAIGYDTLVEQTNAQLAAEGIEGLGAGAVIASLLLGIAINLALWFLVSVLRIEFVKWIVVLLTAWGVLSLALALGDGLQATMISGIIATILSVIAVWFLFQPDAKAWFAQKRENVDPE